MTKREKVLNHLKSGKSIDSMTAFINYNVTRLSADIEVLRGRGYDITTTLLPTQDGKSKYAVYQLRG